MRLPALLLACSFLPAADLTLWYDGPAVYEKDRPGMNQALPIGNGRQGSLVFGGIANDRLVLNEDSLWTGGDNPSGDYGKMGEYRCAGELMVDLAGQGEVSGYRRELDLETAVARVRYHIGSTQFSREYAASAVDRVQVARYTASVPGSYTGTVGLKDWHNATLTVEGTTITAVGSLSNGMGYETQVRVIADGGSVSATAGRLAFTGCDALTVLWTVGTDYVMDGQRRWKGDAPHARLTQAMAAAAAKPAKDILADHTTEYRRWFDRVRLDLGAPTAAQTAMPTDQRRLEAGRKGGDPSFAALVFQYGRYLLISCSRPGSLPANLQGLWNESNNPAWHCDYHTNINVQMNYWPAEVTNLSECHLPLFDLIESQVPSWRIGTAASKDFAVAGKPARGWTVRTSHNIHGGMGWKWDNTSNAWYGLHFWEHYVFTGDRDFLAKRAYPLLKEVAEFWDDHLKALSDGRMVVPNGWSPEHGPTEDGVAYSQQIVHDLFTNYVEAADILGVDKAYRDRIAGLRDRLVLPGIGSWGQLLEWMTEKNTVALDATKELRKNPEQLVVQLKGGKEGSVAATVWKAIPEAQRQAIEATPTDAKGVVDGLNAVIAGPSLAGAACFATQIRETVAGVLATKAAANPALVPWLNRTLIVDGLNLRVSVDDTPNDHHRHTSHLFAVFPGRGITPATTPERAEAAATSVIARGVVGDVREWSCAWRTNIHARLHQGDRAERMVRSFMTMTCANLFGNHPPMQIDGNFGIAAGIAEMLVQSHAGAIDLLPALPAAWPTGSVSGLKARGGATIDLAWADGALTTATVTATVDGPLTLRLGSVTRTIPATAGGRYRLDKTLAVTPAP